MNAKKCTKCGSEKPLSEYHKCSDSKDGLKWHCKSCVKKYKATYYIDNRKTISKKSSERYRNNQEHIRERSRQYKRENKEKIAEYNHDYREEHIAEIYERQRKWNKKNAKKISRRAMKLRSENTLKSKAARANKNKHRSLRRSGIGIEPCEKCGRPGKHFHHPDYSKPNDVIPLCIKCHLEIHGKKERILEDGQAKE